MDIFDNIEEVKSQFKKDMKERGYTVLFEGQAEIERDGKIMFVEKMSFAEGSHYHDNI